MLASMNRYTVIILTALLASYALEIICGLLTLRSLKDDPPDELRDVFDPALYRKSQEYARVRLRFGFVNLTVHLIALLAFWFIGGFNFLDLVLRRLGWPELVTGVVYIGVLSFARGLINLPFNIYATFVIEEKFGFNKITREIFVADIFRNMILSVLLWLPLLVAILWIFETAGAFAWLYVWALVTAFTIAIQLVVPMMSVLNRAKPLKDEALKQAIFDYAHSVKYPLKDIVVMNISKRTAKMNAFSIGIGKNKRIALFDTLLNKFSIEELVAIIAHEIGHYKRRHLLKRTLLKIISIGVMFYLLSLFIGNQNLFEAFGMTSISNYAGLVFFGLLYTPIKLILSVGMNALSRQHEFEADRFSADTTGHRDALITALKKLSAHNLTNLTPHPITVFFYYSHPPLGERIKALQP